MNVLIKFLIGVSLIYLYLIYYHKIEIINILDLTHSTFIRQMIFELVPFFVLFGIRDMQFINITSASEFFSSIIGRSIMSTVGFTIVTIILTKINNPVKLNPISISNKKEEVKEEIKEVEIRDEEVKDEETTDPEEIKESYSNIYPKKYMKNNNKLNNLLLQSTNIHSYSLI